MQSSYSVHSSVWKDSAVFDLIIIFWAMIFKLPHCETQALEYPAFAAEDKL